MFGATASAPLSRTTHSLYLNGAQARHTEDKHVSSFASELCRRHSPTTRCADCRLQPPPSSTGPLRLSDSGDSCQMYFVCERFSGICKLPRRIPADGRLASLWNLSHRRSPGSSAVNAEESATENWNHRDPHETFGDSVLCIGRGSSRCRRVTKHDVFDFMPSEQILSYFLR
jgi:hypothetical protein